MIGKLLLIGLLVFLTSSTQVEGAPLRASPCTLGWNTCTNTSVNGYTLYYGITGSATTNLAEVGLTNQATLKGLFASSNYFFFVVAYNSSSLTSSPSAVIYYKPPAVSSLKLAPSTNGAMKVSFRAATNAACHVEYAPTLNSRQWHTLSSAIADANGNVTIADPLTGKPSSRYYRAAVP